MADITNNITGSTTTITSTYDESTNVLSINIKGTITRNYLFDIKCTYVDTTGSTKEVDVETDSTGLQANVTLSDCDTSKEITITGGFERSVRITDNTTNCTNSFAKAYRVTENSITGVVQPIKGYTFDESAFNIVGSYTDKYGSTAKKTFTRVDANNATYTFAMSDVKSSNAITLTGTAQESETPTGLTINNEVTGEETNVTYSIDESTNALVITIEGTKKTCYMFGIVAAYTNTSETSVNIPFDISESGLSASTTITDCDTSKEITITGEFVAAHRVTNNVHYCTTNLANAYRVTDDVLAVFVPNDGYYFSETDFNLSVTYINKYGESISKTLTRTNESEATITLTTDLGIANDSSLIFNGDAQVRPEEEINLGSIYAYIVDNDVLDAFSKKRYFQETSSYYLYDIDLGDYVNRIKRIYANIPKGSETILKCGNYSTEIECNAIKSEIYTCSFGYVKLPLINGDSNDFNSNVSLMLPFIGIVDVDSSLLGHTVGLDIFIDVITGDGVYKLTSDGYPVKTYECTPSQDILYHTYNETTIGGDKWNSGLLYGLDPYFIIKYHQSVTKDINTTTLQTDIGNIKGFAKFENVNVNINCLADEQSEIQTLLSSGVIL